MTNNRRYKTFVWDVPSLESWYMEMLKKFPLIIIYWESDVAYSILKTHK